MTAAVTFLGENPAAASVTADSAVAKRSLEPFKVKPRYCLSWTAGQRGKPGLNADIQNAAEATRMIADPDFELLGTSATSGSSAFYAEGGITLTTAGASADQVILLPHLDANQSAWAQVTWGTDQEVDWEGLVQTGASIAAATIWAGLKITNTPTVITDADQAFFRYEPATNGGKWQVVYSVGGTDYTEDTGVTVVASTRYLLAVHFDEQRFAHFFINGAKVAQSKVAMTNAVDLIPYIGVQADAAAAKSIVVMGEAISRNLGA
jgi:hypothetical protein